MRGFITRRFLSAASWLAYVLTSFVLAATSYSQDSVEFLNGLTLEGKILEIRKDEKVFDFQSKIGDQQLKRTYAQGAK